MTKSQASRISYQIYPQNHRTAETGDSFANRRTASISHQITRGHDQKSAHSDVVWVFHGEPGDSARWHYSDSLRLTIKSGNRRDGNFRAGCHARHRDVLFRARRGHSSSSHEETARSILRQPTSASQEICSSNSVHRPSTLHRCCEGHLFPGSTSVGRPGPEHQGLRSGGTLSPL